MTSNVNDLSARLRRRMETEELETTATAERELRKFGETLNASANEKLRITEAVMEAEVGQIQGQIRGIRELLWRDFRTDLVIVVSILLIIFVASWGLMQWQLNRVQRLLETQETLQLEIAQAQTALEQLQAQTWGVRLYEAEDGTRYVLFPKGALGENWPWIVQGQPALQLSSE